ncbi:MAG: hypothetical protein C5B57_04480, partial [Blastocatellia bacterium]
MVIGNRRHHLRARAVAQVSCDTASLTFVELMRILMELMRCTNSLMSSCVIGIDAGATKTVAYLADNRGHLLEQTNAPGANLYTSGHDGVERVMQEVLEALTRHREVAPAAVCVGMAGVDSDEESWTIRTILRRVGCEAPT